MKLDDAVKGGSLELKGTVVGEGKTQQSLTGARVWRHEGNRKAPAK